MRLGRAPLTAQAIGAFLAARADLAPDTLSRYHWSLSHLAHAHQRLPRAPHALETLIAATTYAPASRDALWRDLHAFYHWAHNRLGVPNVMDDVRRRKTPRQLPRNLTNDQLHRLLNLPLSRRDTALIMLLLNTGVRIGELAALRWPQIHTDHITVTGKTGDHNVPISANTARALVGLGDSHHVWVGRRGPMTRDGLKLTVRRILAQAGIAAGPHALRHTVGRDWLMNGGDLETLRRLLGHTKIDTTTIYTALNDVDLQAKHARHNTVARLEKEA
jgi:integrase